MIRQFSHSILRFPIKWANAVAAWIANLCSDGSLIIQNSMNPSEGTPCIKVNTGWLSSTLWGMNTIKDNYVQNDKDWTRSPLTLRQTGTGNNLAPTENTQSTDYRKDNWAFGTAMGLSSDNKTAVSFENGDTSRGVEFDVLTRSVYEVGGVDYLYFRTITVSPLGVITKVSAENKCIAVRDIRFE